MSKTRGYHEVLIDSLADPDEARHYLSAVLAEYPEGFLKALRNVAEARKQPNASDSNESNEGASLAEMVELLSKLGMKLTISSSKPTEADEQISLVRRRVG